MERVFYGVFSDIKYTLKISEKSISRAKMLIKWGWGIDHTVVFYGEFLNNVLFAFQKRFFCYKTCFTSHCTNIPTDYILLTNGF